ncbi:hypothetical protein [Lacrimispora sp.]|uniref:hypothetical protein n=1 Tax=Lacrimispora sp. TaxID=2719234 RepID=UPI0028A8BA10|nr:hypothetical protein [Lacrimispora sp.]
MKNKLMKAAIILIKLYVLYVFTIAGMLAMMIGIAKPVLGIGGVVVAASVLSILSIGGGANDSGRNEDDT